MKNYSKKYNVVFVHIPKNAGTSINDTLEINKKDRGHKSLLEVEKILPINI